jgi:hypothetical protein
LLGEHCPAKLELKTGTGVIIIAKYSLFYDEAVHMLVAAEVSCPLMNGRRAVGRATPLKPAFISET